jgi:hypothetical protein
LKRLSPSTSVTIRRGTLSRRRTAVAATASGGETIAPKAKATGQPISGRSACATTATTPAVASVNPTASDRIERSWALTSRIAVSNAAM